MASDDELFVRGHHPHVDNAGRCRQVWTMTLVGGPIDLDTEPRRRVADALADGRGPLADARGEDQAINTAEHGGERADILGDSVDEIVDGEPRLRIGATQQVAHVVADAGVAKQSRLLVEHRFYGCRIEAQRLEQVKHHTWIDRPGARAHAEAIEGGKAERAVDALAVLHRA